MQGLGDRLELPNEEMYGEPFLVPEPLETVLISWFEGGEVFRSGLTYQRGAGRIFYFRPGHETYPTYHDPTIQQILRNAVHWAYNPAAAWHDVAEAPNVPVDRAPEKITAEGRLAARGRRGGLPVSDGSQRLLILGTGAIARHHAERFAAIPGCSLVAAVDANAERARDFAAAYAIPQRLRLPRRGDRLGRVRRRRQLHPRPGPHADDDAADRRRQAGVLREAAGPQRRPTRCR